MLNVNFIHTITFRGNKEMLYEGGVRGVAMVTGKMRKSLRGSENNG